MTPDTALNPIEEQVSNQPPSTAGMTTRVVKGSIWTLAGQIAPLFATLVATPITIRLLGTERYGLLILIGVLPMYFSFADLGMNVASTRFASAAFGAGNAKQEREVMWTAAIIASMTSLTFVIPLIIFAAQIMELFRVPEELQAEGALALRITAAGFLLTILTTVVNSPQLARLRMDLNSAIGGGSRILMALAVPVVLYFGGGLVGAATVGLVVGLLALSAHLIVSANLLGKLFPISVSRELVRPMVKFGLGVFFSGIVGALLSNFEKVMLPRIVSMEALAYYSVAFTFASMTTMLAIAMVQSLVPAFSQLTAPEKREEFDGLFSRGVRLNLIWLPPVVMILFVIARPFFTVWAGEEFGRSSTLPFYILLAGLFFNLVAYVPYSAVTAVGRTDVLAKVSWVQFGFFVVASLLLMNAYGVIGAALAWTLRGIADTFVVIWLSKRYAHVNFNFVKFFGYLLFGLLVLSPPMFIAAVSETYPVTLILTTVACALFYPLLSWKLFVEDDEKRWLTSRIRGILGRHA